MKPRFGVRVPEAPGADPVAATQGCGGHWKLRRPGLRLQGLAGRDTCVPEPAGGLYPPCMNPPSVTPRRWTPLGSPPLDKLREARDQLHWAVQLLAASGQALAEPKDDDSHRGFAWVDGWLVGAKLRGMIQVAIRPHDLTLSLRDAKEVEIDRTTMRGRTLPQCQSWLQATIGGALDGTPPALELPDWDLPVHAVGHGADFGPDAGALETLAAWYANADLMLSNVAFAHPEAGPVRGWPHHFDIATLLTLPPGSEGPRTVGAGMTPGDKYYPEPYWYVSPWPYPADASSLPELDTGSWHTHEWTGAVLTYPETVGSATDPMSRKSTVKRFLNGAVQAARRLAVGDL